MKAAILYGLNDIRCENADIPDVGINEELFHVSYAGICGSDIDRVYGKGAYHYPIILGHEFSGYRQGSGKKAVVFPMIPCMKCAMCQIGEYASCSDYDYYGSRRNGGFAEYIAVNKWNIIEAPIDVDMEALAMTEPAAVALHAIDMLALKQGQSVLITGAGPIGLLLGQWARLSGAGKVYYVDIDKRKLKCAEELGFMIYCGEKVDAAVEGTGVSAPLSMCLEAVRAKSIIVLMGNPSGDIRLTQNEYWHILRKQLILKGTWNSSYNILRNEWQISVDAISNGKLDVMPLISHRFMLDDCATAFAVLYKKDQLVNKVMFKVGGTLT
jgi:L-iditol 2-dehydrogenase